MKKKPIQVVEAWRYPCNADNIFGTTPHGVIMFETHPYSAFQISKPTGGFCPCDKNCPAQRIKITVEEVT